MVNNSKIRILTVILASLLIVFIFLPNGWNFIPLVFAVVVLFALTTQLKLNKQENGLNDEKYPVEDNKSSHNDTVIAFEKRSKFRLSKRLNRAFGPIAAGLIIDFVDLSTFGPIGLFLGMPIGGFAGYWMGRALGLARAQSLWCALAAGIYCTMPGTEFIPLATIVGAAARFYESGKDKNSGK